MKIPYSAVVEPGPTGNGETWQGVLYLDDAIVWRGELYPMDAVGHRRAQLDANKTKGQYLRYFYARRAAMEELRARQLLEELKAARDCLEDISSRDLGCTCPARAKLALLGINRAIAKSEGRAK